jgi:hypothetical protein
VNLPLEIFGMEFLYLNFMFTSDVTCKGIAVHVEKKSENFTNFMSRKVRKHEFCHAVPLSMSVLSLTSFS